MIIYRLSSQTERHDYAASEVLVVGDDPESKIKAAKELGIDTVLYDKYSLHPAGLATHKISDYKELVEIV